MATMRRVVSLPSAASGRTSNSLRPPRPAACRDAQSRPTTRPITIGAPASGRQPYFDLRLPDLPALLPPLFLAAGAVFLAAALAAGLAARTRLTAGLAAATTAACARSATVSMSSRRPFEYSPSLLT